jgi:hypothetical protein
MMLVCPARSIALVLSTSCQQVADANPFDDQDAAVDLDIPFGL